MNLNLRCPEILHDKNDFNYQQELSRFLHTECSKPTDCRIMIVKKPNLILEARYCAELVEETM